MRATRRPTRPARKFAAGDRVVNRLGVAGTVVFRTSPTQVRVKFTDGADLDMYDSSLTAPLTEAGTGRQYCIVKTFTAAGTHLEARTGRRYNAVKRYI